MCITYPGKVLSVDPGTDSVYASVKMLLSGSERNCLVLDVVHEVEEDCYVVVQNGIIIDVVTKEFAEESAAEILKHAGKDEHVI